LTPFGVCQVVTAVGHASSVTYMDLASWGMGVLILMGLSKWWG
jgi:hypothetical protein